MVNIKMVDRKFQVEKYFIKWFYIFNGLYV